MLIRMYRRALLALSRRFSTAKRISIAARWKDSAKRLVVDAEQMNPTPEEVLAALEAAMPSDPASKEGVRE